MPTNVLQNSPHAIAEHCAHTPFRDLHLLPFLAYTFLHFQHWKLNVLPYTLTLGCALLTYEFRTTLSLPFSISKAARE
jgi:hypothetical protein